MDDRAKVDTPEQGEFRAYCREWLSKSKPKPFTGEGSNRCSSQGEFTGVPGIPAGLAEIGPWNPLAGQSLREPVKSNGISWGKR